MSIGTETNNEPRPNSGFVKDMNDGLLSVALECVRRLDGEELCQRLDAAVKAYGRYEAIGILDGNPKYYNTLDQSKAQIRLVKAIIEVKEALKALPGEE